MIKLKKITSDDYSYFMEQNNNPATLSWMQSDRVYKREDFYAILASNVAQWYVIYDRVKIHRNERKWIDEKVGLFTMYPVNDKLHAGIIIDERHRRKGHAREVFNLFLTALDEEGQDTYLSCFKDNFAINLYKELGYKEYKEIEVRGREYVFMKRLKKG